MISALVCVDCWSASLVRAAADAAAVVGWPPRWVSSAPVVSKMESAKMEPGVHQMSVLESLSDAQLQEELKSLPAPPSEVPESG